MKKDFKDKIQAAKIKGSTPVKNKEGQIDFNSLIPEEDQSYLPKTRVPPRPPNSTLSRYKCVVCESIFEDVVDKFGRFGESVCNKCARAS